MDFIKPIVISAEDFLDQIPKGRHVRILTEKGFDWKTMKHPLEDLLYDRGIGNYSFDDSPPERKVEDYVVDLNRLVVKGYTSLKELRSQ